jgi:hypothetical protein
MGFQATLNSRIKGFPRVCGWPAALSNVTLACVSLALEGGINQCRYRGVDLSVRSLGKGSTKRLPYEERGREEGAERGHHVAGFGEIKETAGKDKRGGS